MNVYTSIVFDSTHWNHVSTSADQAFTLDNSVLLNKQSLKLYYNLFFLEISSNVILWLYLEQVFMNYNNQNF